MHNSSVGDQFLFFHESEKKGQTRWNRSKIRRNLIVFEKNKEKNATHRQYGETQLFYENWHKDLRNKNRGETKTV